MGHLLRGFTWFLSTSKLLRFAGLTIASVVYIYLYTQHVYHIYIYCWRGSGRFLRMKPSVDFLFYRVITSSALWSVITWNICLRVCWMFELPNALVASVCACDPVLRTRFCQNNRNTLAQAWSNTTNPPTQKTQQARGTAPDFLAAPVKLQKSGGRDAGCSISYLLRCIWMPERIADGRSNNTFSQNNTFSHKSKHPLNQNRSCDNDVASTRFWFRTCFYLKILILDLSAPEDPEIQILIVDLPVL